MKWAIREAVDVYFKAKSRFQLGARTIRAGEPVLIFDTVQTSALEVAAEIAYVTGGRGNARILSFEGDKTLTFNFEDALLSNEGLAILSGADLIPARNPDLVGAPIEARTVKAHNTEKYAVTTVNIHDADATNTFPIDPTIPGEGTGRPRGGELNVWLQRRPFVGQNASIYVMLLDNAGEMSGSPIEINLFNNEWDTGGTGVPPNATPINRRLYLAKFNTTEGHNMFIAIGHDGNPIPHNAAGPNNTTWAPTIPVGRAAEFDDLVAHYISASAEDQVRMAPTWPTAWPAMADCVRTIVGPYQHVSTRAAGAVHTYSYLLAPPGGVAQPRAFKEGMNYVYKVNVPSILFQDIVLLDYYVEYRRNATQISILPDKFGPFMYVEGSSLVRRASDGMDLPAEFVIPKFKITTALTFTMAATGDPGTFNFQGDAYPDFSKFDLTRRVLADIQVLDADDNFDQGFQGAPMDPTDYRRFHYTDNDGEYLWKDPSMQPHSNIDYADTNYEQHNGGPPSTTPGVGLINTANRAGA